ncbi:unnamed protein product [Medioppia subpectinata]|uniref:Uncharacterized protein n=1 Tax=Medioppia subpectinata TaxID=1979941 RepID=A0A7R9KKM1_9ACAR|nr:unnamed protein product [Medioppia subpectinata]CAG2105325.1 unnamed protein product [Medioppia subpectinata]
MADNYQLPHGPYQPPTEINYPQTYELPFDKTRGIPGTARRTLVEDRPSAPRLPAKPGLFGRRDREAPYGRAGEGQQPLHGPMNYADYQTSWYRWPNLNLERPWQHELRSLNQLGFIFEVPLGRGGFGEVWRVYRISDNKHWAAKIQGVKKFDDLGFSLKQGMAYILRDIEHTRGLSHPHIVAIESVVHLKDTRTDFQSLFVVTLMDLMHGNLIDAIKESPDGRMNETDARHWFLQIGSAVAYLHAQRVSHMDIKADNILYKHQTPVGAGRGPTRKLYKLSDFGLSLTYRAGQPMTGTDAVGTEYCMAPEMTSMSAKLLKTRFDTTLCDVYALGVTLAQSVIGVPALRPPFNAFTWGYEVHQWVADHLIATKRFQPTSCLIQLLDFMTAREPSMRMTSEQLGAYCLQSAVKMQTFKNIGFIMASLSGHLKLRDVEEVSQPIDNGTNWFDSRHMHYLQYNDWIFGPKDNFTDQMVSEMEQTLKLIRYTTHPMMVLLPNLTFITQYQHINNSFNTTDQIFDFYNKNPKKFIYSPNTTDAVLPVAKLQLYPKHRAKVSIGLTVLFISMAIVVIFSQLMPIMTSNLVKEKEKRMKDVMFMMGLRPNVYWFVWFSIEAIVVLVLSLFLSMAYSVSGFIPNLDSYTTFFWLFPMILMFGLTIIQFSAIYSKFFNKEMTSTQMISIVMLVSFVPVFLISGIFVTLPQVANYLLLLFSPSAITFGIKAILTISYINDSKPSLDTIFNGSDIPLGMALTALLAENILYSLLALYLEKVIPEQFGTKLGFCFCFDPNYWFPRKTAHLTTESADKSADVEEVSDELKGKAIIQMKSVSKKFANEKTFAVNNVSMTIYGSQITALLGHNGAGKTTLINMMIGVIAPTSGSIHINGYEATDASDVYHLRSMFGICLQENALLDELNSEEHLLFFGAMKGLSGKRLVEEVNQLLLRMDLLGNRWTHSKDLSGGQKRKLCIALALIGDPKVVVLDEPTSGVDVAIRRQIWSILQSHKANKTIIMTTHFMEEADILCDRKAILTKGSLRCVGSSLFLKKKFGIGYHLTVDTQKDVHIKDITSLVTSDIPTARLSRSAGTEVFYILPQNESQKFSQLFSTLEKSQNTVKSFGISMTTLEEVFLKLEDESAANVTKTDLNANVESVDSNTVLDIKYRPNFWDSFWAYFRIKWVKPEEIKAINLQTLNDSYMTVIIDRVKPEEIKAINLQTLNDSYMTVIIDRFENENIDWKWIFNETHLYSLPILQNLMANTYFSAINGQNKRFIQTTNYPFVLSRTEVNENPVKIFLIFYAIMYLFLFSLLIGQLFAFDTIDDRETKIIETIRISGMGFWCYWLTNLFMHSVLLIIELLLVFLLVTFLVRLEYLDSMTTRIAFLLHLIVSSIAFMQTNYVFGYFFATKATAHLLLVYEMILFLSLMFYMFLLRLIDSPDICDSVLRLISKSNANHNLISFDSPLEDSDVLQERREVNAVLQNKHKKNNILGLLGPNGAGKTTTMRVITKQEIPTSGLVSICGQEMHSSYLRQVIGYCPQQDTLWKNITVREHLTLFAIISGVQKNRCNHYIHKHMNDLKITEHADKETEHLSGGTKRKVCYILSLMGDSKLVLLDEPSTGMDPYSKRFLWTTIQSTFNGQTERSAVLTTHSMEEANALCNRIAIMTRGVMRCIGSAQHLKNRYGAGYVLDIKWQPIRATQASIQTIISGLFFEWTVREVFDNRMTADIPQQSVPSLSAVFSSLERLKADPNSGVDEYSLSQTTLEQVFIYFAKDGQQIAV